MKNIKNLPVLVKADCPPANAALLGRCADLEQQLQHEKREKLAAQQQANVAQAQAEAAARATAEQAERSQLLAAQVDELQRELEVVR